MIFNSIQYLFFLPLVTLLYYLLPVRFRWLMLLTASCYFYMFFVPVYILILAFTITIDYLAGRLIENAGQRNKKTWLLLSLFANLGVLCVFKYYNFFIENVDHFLRSMHIHTFHFPYLSILLPIGLSFHTFQAMSYTIEVYKGKQKAEHHFGIYALYVMFFPQLVAGPIERPQHLLPQFHFGHRFEWSNMVSGLRIIMLGMFKKVVVADQLNVLVNYVYNDISNAKGVTVYLGALFFTMQIYCDFSGYSDIARGSAKLMGIELVENFKLPFYSASFPEFWTRWHVSLMNWFRDYVYIPLGGSRVNKSRAFFNIFIVFFLSGIWHGANWTYIFWGMLSGLIVIYSRITAEFRKSIMDKLGFTGFPRFRRVLQSLGVIHILALDLIFFRSASISNALTLIKNFFSGFSDTALKIISNENEMRQQILYLGKDSVAFGLIILFAILLESFQWRTRNKSIDSFLGEMPLVRRYFLYIFVIFSIVLMSNVVQTPFVYFQF